MTTINVCGFESGNGTEAFSTGGTFSVQAVTKRTGNYALRCNPASGAAGYHAIGAAAATGEAANINRTGETFYTCYIQFAALPPAGQQVRFLSVQSASTVVVRLNCTSSGQITLTGTTTQNVGSPISAGTWYRIDLRVTSNGISGAAIDGGSETTVTANNVTQNELTVGRRVTSETVAFDCYYDDIYISDSAFPGAGEVRALRPDGDGTYTGWTGGSGTTYAEVDDDAPGHDSDTTYIQVPATGDNTARTFSLSSCATAGVAGAIKTAKLHGVCRTESTTSASTVGLRLRSSTTDSDTTGREWTTTYIGYSKLFDTDPATGSAWVSGGLDAVEGGVYAGTIAQAQRATAFWLIVWSAGASGTTENVTVTGAVTPTGATIEQVNVVKAGAITPSGTTAEQVNAIKAGGTIPAGATLEQVNTVITAGTTPSGTVAISIISTALVAGGITPTGDTTEQVNAVYTGATTPSGAMAQQVNANYGGATTPSGDTSEQIGTVIGGTTVPAGGTGTQGQTTLSGALAPSGAVFAAIATTLGGAVTPAGDTSETISTVVAGATVPAGGINTKGQVVLSGAIGPAGTVAITIIPGGGTVYPETVTGAIALTGTVAIALTYAAPGAGSITPAGVVTEVIIPAPPPPPAPAPTPSAGDGGMIWVASDFPYTERPREVEVEVLAEAQRIAVAAFGAVQPFGDVAVSIDWTGLYRREDEELMLMGVL